MKTDTRENIYKYILNNKPVGVKEICNVFGFSKEIIHRHLKKLIEENKIYKSGTPPKVYYFPSEMIVDIDFDISKENKKIIDENFLVFLPDGKIELGIKGFYNWCEKRNVDYKKEIGIYIETLKKYKKFFDENGLINGMQKMQSTFEKIYLDEVYYFDFYSIEKYGKTKLGNLMFYGKQSGDKNIISDVLNIIKPKILDFLDRNHVDSIAYIPPSIKRNIQILDKIDNGLNINLPKLKLIKIFKDKIVSQKSLSRREDRIINARDTIFIENKNMKANKILLIDDAIGSGSTLNETAKKIKELGICNYVIGIAIVGSFKGFEVINEV